MTYLPEPHPNCRAARVRPAEITPAVLGFQDGGRTQGQLEVISLTGGLLSLSKPAVRGSHAQLMFVTDSGPVLGEAEMLSSFLESAAIPVRCFRRRRSVQIAHGDLFVLEIGHFRTLYSADRK